MEKGEYVRVIEGEEVRRDDPVKYFLPGGVGSTSWGPEGVMAIEVPRMKRFLQEGRMEGEKELVLLFVGANRGAYTIRKDTDEELLREMLTPT